MSPPEALTGIVDRLADPGLPAETFDALAEALLADDVWPRVPTASLARFETDFTFDAESSDPRFRLLDALWRRLDSHPALREDLEDRYLATLRALPSFRAPAIKIGFLLPLTLAPESGLSRRVPSSLLDRWVEELPIRGAWFALRMRSLVAIAAVRGPWPAFLDYLREALRGNPSALSFLPPGSAERFLGGADAVDRLVLSRH